MKEPDAETMSGDVTQHITNNDTSTNSNSNGNGSDSETVRSVTSNSTTTASKMHSVNRVPNYDDPFKISINDYESDDIEVVADQNTVVETKQVKAERQRQRGHCTVSMLIYSIILS